MKGIDSPAQRVADAEEWRPRLMGLKRAYMSTGVRIAWVNEQQAAPAKAYLEYSPTLSSLSNDLAIGSFGICWGVWTAATSAGGDGGEPGECPSMLEKV